MYLLCFRFLGLSLQVNFITTIYLYLILLLLQFMFPGFPFLWFLHLGFLFFTTRCGKRNAAQLTHRNKNMQLRQKRITRKKFKKSCIFVFENFWDVTITVDHLMCAHYKIIAHLHYIMCIATEAQSYFVFVPRLSLAYHIL